MASRRRSAEEVSGGGEAEAECDEAGANDPRGPVLRKRRGELGLEARLEALAELAAALTEYRPALDDSVNLFLRLFVPSQEKRDLLLQRRRSGANGDHGRERARRANGSGHLDAVRDRPKR